MIEGLCHCIVCLSMLLSYISSYFSRPSLSPPSSATLFMAPQAFLTGYVGLRSQYSVLNQGVISLFKVIVFRRLIKRKNVPLS